MDVVRGCVLTVRVVLVRVNLRLQIRVTLNVMLMLKSNQFLIRENQLREREPQLVRVRRPSVNVSVQEG